MNALLILVGKYLKLINVLGKEGMALLKRGEVDFCVGPIHNIPEDIKFIPIVSYDPVLITPKKHPLAKRKKNHFGRY